MLTEHNNRCPSVIPDLTLPYLTLSNDDINVGVIHADRTQQQVPLCDTLPYLTLLYLT